MASSASALVAASLGSLILSCGGTSTGPPSADDVTIVVHTTGGIAALDWTATLDGAAGEIRCAAPCPWNPQEKRAVSDAEVEEIARAFVGAGVRRRSDLDFGICAGCADQFHYEIEYRDATGAHHVEGDGPNLPDDLQAAVARIIFQTTPK